MKKLIVLLALASGLWLPQAGFAEEQLLDEIVAVVDDDVILRSDLDRTVANIIKQFNARGVQLPPRSVLERQVLERLILQNAIENEGQRFADFREDIRKEMLADRVSRGWAESQAKVSEEDVDLFLASNNLNQGEVKLRHIASLATQVSAGQKALEGGDLGWRPVNQLPQLFADQISAMKVGEITHPVRSPSGFHLIKLEGKRDSEQKMIDGGKVFGRSRFGAPGRRHGLVPAASVRRAFCQSTGILKGRRVLQTIPDTGRLAHRQTQR